MDGVKKDSCEEITKQQPTIPLYDQLSEKNKKEVLRRGEQEFGSQIEASQKDAMGKVAGKLDPNQYTDKIKNVVPMDSISGITESAKSRNGRPNKGIAYKGSRITIIV